ncbi:biotin--[acetyl-CoA-carboxylase] ligase [Calothrix sp. NIES-4071]|nr:biotin--[acetyl-CoA-carboxylase] ligase [Calothrix sp. NIES-4071]BAZ58109.1 biotin--[acetyl-CoA-carboxylase] ligase [Calothrix sp. NIES-4105]
MLDKQTIEAALDARQSHYLPFSLHLYSCVTSTNQVLWELMQQGNEHGCVVIAEQQTAGRGQWGRQWVSSKGGLYISVAIAPNIEARDSYQLTFATAWGITKQLRNSNIPVEIKWPNDLVLNKLKLGGILTETKINHGKISSCVIGVGINFTNQVPKTGINLQSWQQQGIKEILNIEMLATKVLLGIESGIECLDQDGVDVLLPKYTSLLTNIGEGVCLEDLSGTVVGVTSTGCLHVRMETFDSKSVDTPDLFLSPGTISLGYGNS